MGFWFLILIFFPYKSARAVPCADYPAFLVAGHSRCKLFGGFLPDWVRCLLSRPANKTDRLPKWDSRYNGCVVMLSHPQHHIY